MLTNPVEKQILELIEQDIECSGVDYSTLTNNEIATILNKSVFTVRDKITKLQEKKYILRRTDVWVNNSEYHNRVIYMNRAPQLDRR